MKLWSENIAGNLHDATRYLNSIGVTKVVAMHSFGSSSIVVYRISDHTYDLKMKEIASRRELAKQPLKFD